MTTRPPIHRPHPRATTRPCDERRGSTASRGYDHIWRAKRLAYLREHPLCVECLARGVTEPATDVDHITAMSKGGDMDGPWQALCHACHSRKTATVDRRRGTA